MDILEVIKLKELRGNIIEILYMRYGDNITVSMLRSLLRYKSYSGEKELPNAINYLSGEKKEYVTVTLNKENYDDSLIKLTPTGVNLAEGDIIDSGVNINE